MMWWIAAAIVLAAVLGFLEFRSWRSKPTGRGNRFDNAHSDANNPGSNAVKRHRHLGGWAGGAILNLWFRRQLGIERPRDLHNGAARHVG